MRDIDSMQGVHLHSISGHIMVGDLISGRIVGCQCGAFCPPYLSVTSWPSSDSDWWNDHITFVKEGLSA